MNQVTTGRVVTDRDGPVGLLVAVVGPSGAGKDSVMAGLCAARPGIALVRRVITRPSDAGGEDFDGVSSETFEARRAAGDFALHWQAHGLSYGIPRAQTDRMAEGRILLVNLSRQVLAQAHAQFGPAFRVLAITAPREVLARRLTARGRETPEDIARRLDRSMALPEGLPGDLPVTEIDNGGALDRAVQDALTALDAHKEGLSHD